MMAYNDGSFGYEMEIIVKADSAIQSPAEIKGRTMAFTSPTSNSGFKAPSAILKGEFGLVAEKDFTPAFSGKHDNSILGVYNGDYEIAAIANSVLFRMADAAASSTRANCARSTSPRPSRPRATDTHTTCTRSWLQR